MKYEPKTTPFKHQAKATLRAVKHRSYALFMEPRTGKSKSALDAAAILQLKGEVERVAILCPKVALEVWDTQIKKHYPYRAELEDHQFQWVRNGSGDRSGHTTRFYLLGYERAARRVRKGSRWIRPYLAEVERWNPDLIVLDESHRLKRAGGVSSQGIWRMVARLRQRRGDGRPYVLLLTGTPTPKGKIDLFAQFRILDEKIFGTNKEDFEDEYCVYGHGKRRFTIIRYRNEKRLDRLVRAHSFAISQDEAGLAKKQFSQVLHCELPPKIRRHYDELAEEFLTEIDGIEIEGKNAGAVRTRLLQVTGGFTTQGEQLHTAKTRLFTDYARVVLEQQEPLLVYCRFSPEVAACVELAAQLGYHSFPFEGATTDKDRARALKALERRRDPVCITFQVQAGSLALDLSAASEVVYYSSPDGWEAYWQSRNRVLGPNQTRPVRYTHLVARGTLDRRVLAGLIRKEDQHALMMRNPRRYLTGL